ncbi:MAG: TusE/DsrC/DsvC family sulfur relay protein, partial [Planctomycetes bacterium]|nr:TusE/DsrC/DsvC family sulfur relay protein [Planctomycetota bacterium]
MSVNLDDEGYLVNYDSWDENVAHALAEREGVQRLTEEKMEIFRFMRSYYREYRHFPVLNAICRNVHQEKDCVKHRFLDPLIAWKIAGLPKP